MSSLLLRMLDMVFIPLRRELARTTGSDQAIQRLLRLHYQQLLAQGAALPNLAETGWRRYSQNDEDGIILYLFSVIEPAHRIFVEIGAGQGLECNCANLALNWGWHGLFVDGDRAAAAAGANFYARHPDTRLYAPPFLAARVTAENVNDVLGGAGFSGEIDFLSLDIDGLEYWIWQALECVSPRVVVVEANTKFAMRSITIPYAADWTYDARRHPGYHGASLPALVKLANRKGYRLVGSNRFGFNAFFVRNDVAAEVLPAVSIESCRTHPVRKLDEEAFAPFQHLPFVEV